MIDESQRPPRIMWSSNGQRGITFRIGNDESAGSTSQILEGYHAEATALREARDPKLDAYEPRIRYLRDEALQDGFTLNRASEIDFRQFVLTTPRIHRFNLVLIDNGNLRATWRDESGERLGLQFLGGKMVQYVIFKQRNSEQAISRVAGRDTFEGLKRQIDAFELRSLVYE